MIVKFYQSKASTSNMIKHALGNHTEKIIYKENLYRKYPGLGKNDNTMDDDSYWSIISFKRAILAFNSKSAQWFIKMIHKDWHWYKILQSSMYYPE